MKLSIIIPVFNEVKTIRAILDKTLGLDLDKEIIVIDDGSKDGTRDVLAAYGREHPDVRIHYSPINLGKGTSVRIGFSMATGDIFAVQDADLELDPAEFHTLIQPILDGSADVVYGSRFLGGERKGHWTFYLANRTLAVITNVLYMSNLTDIETCHKVLRADVVKSLNLKSTRFEIEPEITAQLLRKGYRIKELPIGYTPRAVEEKKIKWRDGVGALTTLLRERV